MPCRHFAAEAPDSCRQSKVLKLRWVELAGKKLKVGRDFNCQSFERLNLAFPLGSRHAHSRQIKLLNAVGQERQPLRDVIVQLSSNPRTLVLLRLNQPAAEIRTGICNFVFCDGSVHSLPINIDIDTLRRLAVRNDGEVVPPDSFN